jgi:hypothetical protein
MIRQIRTALWFAFWYLHHAIGYVLWYFIRPYAEDLCVWYAQDLVDRDELDVHVSYLSRDIDSVRSEVLEMGGFE